MLTVAASSLVAAEMRFPSQSHNPNPAFITLQNTFKKLFLVSWRSMWLILDLLALFGCLLSQFSCPAILTSHERNVFKKYVKTWNCDSFWSGTNVDYYRPERSWGKVIFLEAYVKDSLHRGGCLGRQPPQEQTPPGADTPLGATPPEQCMLGDMGNKWAVWILLESILVLNEIYQNVKIYRLVFISLRNHWWLYYHVVLDGGIGWT